MRFRPKYATGGDGNYYAVGEIVRHNSDYSALARGAKFSPAGRVLLIYHEEGPGAGTIKVRVGYPNGGGITDDEKSFQKVTPEEQLAERLMET
jgi:hypothetical protein